MGYDNITSRDDCIYKKSQKLLKVKGRFLNTKVEFLYSVEFCLLEAKMLKRTVKSRNETINR